MAGSRLPVFALRANTSCLAGAVRVSGALALAWLVLSVVVSFRSGGGDVSDRASSGVPICTVVVALYLLAFLSLTSPALADDAALAASVALGGAAGPLWLTLALVHPPLPPTGGAALVALTVAVIVAAAVSATRHAGTFTASGTGLIGALSIFASLHLALAYGPAAWIPPDSAALTPAARLAQSRAEIGDEYLPLILVGAFAPSSCSSP